MKKWIDRIIGAIAFGVLLLIYISLWAASFELGYLVTFAWGYGWVVGYFKGVEHGERGVYRNMKNAPPPDVLGLR